MHKHFFSSFADYFRNWHHNGEDVLSGADEAGDTVEATILPFEGCDETWLSVGRGNFFAKLQRDGLWKTSVVFPLGELNIDNNANIDGKFSIVSSMCRPLSGTTRFGNVEWAASWVIGKAVDLGFKVGPMFSTFHFPCCSTPIGQFPLEDPEDAATSELSALFPFDDGELVTSIKSTIDGEESALYFAYASENGTVAGEKLLTSPDWTLAASYGVREKTDMSVSLNSEAKEMNATFTVLHRTDDWAVPWYTKFGIDTNLRTGLSVGAELGNTQLAVHADKGVGDALKWGVCVQTF